MPTFAEQLQKRLNQEASFEVPAGAPGQMMTAGRGTPLTQKDYRVDQGVFVLYRPVESCPKCKIAIIRALKRAEVSDGTEDDVEREPLPEECPHIHKRAYLDVLQNCRNAGWVMLNWREETLKNGTVQASITWGVPTETKVKATPRTVPNL